MITGEYLDAGSEVTVLVAGVQCAVHSRSANTILCKTGKWSGAQGAVPTGNVQVRIDNDRKRLDA